MNPYILENAAIFANAYRTACERKGAAARPADLRAKITQHFGAVYAAILIN